VGPIPSTGKKVGGVIQGKQNVEKNKFLGYRFIAGSKQNSHSWKRLSW
jgi:hypothetical protein